MKVVKRSWPVCALLVAPLVACAAEDNGPGGMGSDTAETDSSGRNPTTSDTGTNGGDTGPTGTTATGETGETGETTGTGGSGDTGTDVDDRAPIPGGVDGGLTVEPGSSTAVVRWEAATDDRTPPDQLEYRVYTSDAPDLFSVSAIESNGTPVGPFVTNTTTRTVTELSIESTVYFNVIVRDQAGNRAAYTMANATTVRPFVRIADIEAGSSGSDPLGLIVFDGKLYFSADTTDEGRELWRYDGSNDPAMVIDLVSGTMGSSPLYPEVFDGALYFSATKDGNTELWTYDGSASPTVGNQITQLDDINETGDGRPESLTVAGNVLYFSGDDGSGAELWKYTGSGSPTLVEDLRTGCGMTFTCSGGAKYLMAFEGDIYYQANDGAVGDELWKYTGSGSPTALDINEGDCSGEPCESSPQTLAVYDNALYFSADDGATGQELWRYTGSGEPTRVADIRDGAARSSPGHGVVYDGRLYFSAAASADDRELWVYDGTGDPTMVADLSPQSSNPTDPVVYDGKLYFAATGDGVGTELWVYDGTAAPTPVWDAINGPAEGAEPRHMTVYEGRLYFTADWQQESGRELYVFVP